MDLEVAFAVLGVSTGALCVVSIAVFVVSFAVRKPIRSLGYAPTTGAIAMVAIAIPEGGVGSVRVTGTRTTLPARACRAAAVASGTEVVIVELVDHVATVETLEMEN